MTEHIAAEFAADVWLSTALVIAAFEVVSEVTYIGITPAETNLRLFTGGTEVGY